MAVRPERLGELMPHAAGWYAGEALGRAYYGPPLRLPDDARRLDVSPAWLSWVGAAPALALLEAVGVDALHAHGVGLTNRFRAGLGLPRGDSAIVALALAEDAVARLRSAGITAAGRGERMRFSFHLSTSEADVDRALDALAGAQVRTSHL
jgi:selenocysteine lyase/cysteine desulfurase